MPVYVSCKICDADVIGTIECDGSIIIEPTCDCPMDDAREKDLAESISDAYADIFVDEDID